MKAISWFAVVLFLAGVLIQLGPVLITGNWEMLQTAWKAISAWGGFVALIWYLVYRRLKADRRRDAETKSSGD